MRNTAGNTTPIDHGCESLGDFLTIVLPCSSPCSTILDTNN